MKTRDAVPPEQLTPEGSLDPLQLHAVARLGKEAEKVRKFLDVGEAQPVDFTVRVRGTISVAAGQTVVVPEAPKLADVLKIVFAAVGPANRTRIHDALVDQYPRRESLKLPLEAEHLAKTVIGLLTTEREQPRNGNVTGNVTAEIVRSKR